MSEQTDKLLGELVQRAIEGIDNAVAFSQAQIPEVVAQLLMWDMVTSLIFQSIGIALIAFAIGSWRYAFKAKKNKEDWVFWEGGCSLSSELYDLFTLYLPVPATIVGAVLTLCNFDWLKILLAPKLYLIEYAASLMN